MNPLLDPARRIVIAHRGNRAHAPENTLEALRQAESLGSDALEFDVRMSRDGVAMVIHDATVDRTTDGRGPVAAHTREELQRLNAAARFSGSAVHRIPLLEEALDAHREIPLVIEVKELAAADATMALIRRFGAERRVIVGSAEGDVMRRFYGSGIACCASPGDAGILLMRGLLGSAPVAAPYQVVSVPPRHYGFPIPVALLAAAALRRGIPTQVWTVNDPAEAVRFWRAGVAAIITDDPAAMLRVCPR